MTLADEHNATRRRRLGEVNDAAIAAGVSGSPWIDIDGEAFFGADRLPMLAWRLDQTAARAALYSKSQS